MTDIKNATQLIDALVNNNIEDVTVLINESLNSEESMILQQKSNNIDKLKSWLDSFRPLDPSVVQEMKKVYDVTFTYNSNAIEGNTLSQSETELVLKKGITIGGKSLVVSTMAVDDNKGLPFYSDMQDVFQNRI